MDSGAVSRQIHELWRKAGIYGDNQNLPKRLSCNIIRKSASSGIREMGLGGQQEVADIMAHSIQTAEKHYVRRRKEKSAVAGAEVIRKYFEPVEKKKRVWSEEEEERLADSFKEEIGMQKVTIDNIREKYFTLNIRNASEKQICDKVRSYFRHVGYVPAVKKVFSNFKYQLKVFHSPFSYIQLPPSSSIRLDPITNQFKKWINASIDKSYKLNCFECLLRSKSPVHQLYLFPSKIQIKVYLAKTS